jgi:hypothetical protein
MHTRIVTNEDYRTLEKTLRQSFASFGCLLASQSQGNRVSIFIAVGRYVLSFINRLVRVMRISGGESAIAFFQPRDRLSRGNNWLIGMRRISRPSELSHAKQASYNEGGCEFRLSHASLYGGIALFDQFESQVSKFNQRVARFTFACE